MKNKADIAITALKILGIGLTLASSLIEGKIQNKEIANAVEKALESKGKS